MDHSAWGSSRARSTQFGRLWWAGEARRCGAPPSGQIEPSGCVVPRGYPTALICGSTRVLPMKDLSCPALINRVIHRSWGQLRSRIGIHANWSKKLHPNGPLPALQVTCPFLLQRALFTYERAELSCRRPQSCPQFVGTSQASFCRTAACRSRKRQMHAPCPHLAGSLPTLGSTLRSSAPTPPFHAHPHENHPHAAAPRTGLRPRRNDRHAA